MRNLAARKHIGLFCLLAICTALLGTLGALALAQDEAPSESSTVDQTPTTPQPTPDDDAADPSDETNATEEEPGWGERIQTRANEVFGEVNYHIAPYLFFDISFGVFDPSEQSIDKKLADAQRRLAREVGLLSSEDSAVTKDTIDAIASLVSLISEIQALEIATPAIEINTATSSEFLRAIDSYDQWGVAQAEKIEDAESRLEAVARNLTDNAEINQAIAVFLMEGEVSNEGANPDRVASIVNALREIKAILGWQRVLQGRSNAIEQAPVALENYKKAKADLANLRGTMSLEDQDRASAFVTGLRDRYRALDSLSSASIHEVPLIIVFLLLGAVFFTFRFGFINLRLFTHSIAVIRGKYDNPDDHGEISHFQALTSALSATVGLGNIAGVAIAISQGGAGAVFWMWVVAFFGMSSKFTSCTLAQVYRRIGAESADRGEADATHKALPGGKEHVLGGPMVYLHRGLIDVLGKTLGWPLGKLLAISFAFFAIMGSLGGGNMFQSNQTAEIVSFVILDGDKSYAWMIGIIMTILVALVIVGGIKRIGDVTCKVVPAMCAFYCLVCVIVLLTNMEGIPDLLMSIVNSAFSRDAIAWGGIMGVLVVGIKRGAFSNEAGLGSAAIAHSAAKTAEPVREGVVAMIGPFIDTIVVCTMTALTILITQSKIESSALEGSEGWVRGAAMTAEAFGTLHGFLPFLLCIAVFIFAYSTMISWSYYGERAVEYLFGHRGIWPFRFVFLLFVFLGPMVSLTNVIDFTDMLILSMAYPNILGMVILSGKVAKLSKDYIRRLKTGEIKPYTSPTQTADPGADI